MVPEFLTGSLSPFVVPPSPLEARTVTLFAWASTYACRKLLIVAKPLWNDPSPAPKLCEITSARWLSITYCSAAIMTGNPWTPSVSAVGVVTRTMFARGAVACAHSTSSATSSDQRLPASWPNELFSGGTWAVRHPSGQMMSKRGLTFDAQLPDGSSAAVVLEPHRTGRPNCVLKLYKSCRIVEAPNASTIAIVLPWPWLPAASNEA